MNCEHCKQPILHENSDDQFLEIRSLPRTESGEHSGGAVTDMLITPEIDGPKKFCDLRCLCKWAALQKSPYTGKLFVE